MKAAVKPVVLALCACLFMAGCSAYPGEGETIVYNQAPTDLPDIAVTYPDMAREMSDGNVQVFPMEDETPQPVVPAWGRAGAGQGVQGIASPEEPNVIVYPFEDAPHGMGAVPPIQPPANTGFASPFARDGELAVPAEGGADRQGAGLTGYGAAKIYFNHGSAMLDADDRGVLAQVAQDSVAGGLVQVEGHASERAETDDPVARRIVNLKISIDRAYNVSRELIRKGVPAAAIETRAYGDTRPAPEGEVASRRVEISTSSPYPAY